MKDTETFLESAGETAEYARQYANLQLQHLRLEAAEKLAKVSSAVMVILIVAALGLLALLMLTVAAGFYLGQIWHSYPLGFLCMAGFYALVALVVWYFQERWLTNPLLTTIIRSFFD